MTDKTKNDKVATEGYVDSAIVAAGTGSGAPTTADYLVKTANAGLSSERVVTDTASLVWDWATAAQAKADVQFGTTGTTACAGNDSRLSDARTPSPHATSHKSGGGDAIKLDELAAPTDVTTLNASTTAHGLCPKGTGDGNTFLRDDLSWATPSGSGGAPTTAEYLVGASDGTLSAERVVTNTTTVTWDLAAAGQAKANVASGVFAEQGALTSSGLTMATAKVLGRTTASTGAVEEISVGAGLSLASGKLLVAPLLVATLASDQATGANTTPVDLSGLVFSYAANSTYRIWFMGKVAPAAATTGCGFQFNVSSAVTAIDVLFYHQLANTGTLSGGHSIADDASVGVSSGMPGTSTYSVAGQGLIITTTNTGTAQLRFRSETTAVTTCKAGFTLVVEKIA